MLKTAGDSVATRAESNFSSPISNTAVLSVSLQVYSRYEGSIQSAASRSVLTVSTYSRKLSNNCLTSQAAV